MDKATLSRLLPILPQDASEITVPNLDSFELIFSSDMDTVQADAISARPAQKGTYRGSKRRWRISLTQKSLLGVPIPGAAVKNQDDEGTPISMGEIPDA